MMSSKRWWYAVWLMLIGAFAILHGMHLRADFPNHSPWWMDWAKYTDEGWYGNAAVRAHLFGNWYLPGDFNPAAAVPVWPFLEWILFFATGVSVQAARGLAVAFFFANLLLSYLLLGTRGPRWMALLAVTMLVSSPFLYCFSRLAILEPLMTTLTLGALNLAVRLPRFRRPVPVSAGIGLVFTLMMLTKTYAVFLLPALGWAMVLPLWRSRRLALGPLQASLGPMGRRLILRCVAAAVCAALVSYGAWMALILRLGLFADYEYLFEVNRFVKPLQFDWPLISLWWSFHGGLWVDLILIPMAGMAVVAAGLSRRRRWARRLLLDPVFGASVLAVAGMICFMTYQDHPQPRYFAVFAFFCFFIVAQEAHALLGLANAPGDANDCGEGTGGGPARVASFAFIGLTAVAIGINAAWMLDYALHPEYSFVNVAERLTRYIDEHPNGNRMLVSVSGDEIMLITRQPAINDLFNSPNPVLEFPDLASKLAYYRPGWYACWNQLDPGVLEDLHTRYSVEQVASFRAFDDRTRNVLVLFKLHPWPAGEVREPTEENLRVRFPEDKFDIPLR
jgi:hypothetical protein